MGENLTPENALRRIDEIDRRARRPARAVGVTFIVAGFGTIVYWLVMSLGPGWAKIVAAASWLALTTFFVTQVHRMGTQDREVAWANKPTGPVTVVYGVLIVITLVFGIFLLPDEPGGGWIAALVVLAVCTSLPMFYAAWRVMRAER
ncbi:hypothetical protein [Planobispora longispora]|uniref:Uncharacterized protein n=1 Tax=Planobispora longispora TaxID=28887 RepID=A0A8J3W3X6_9ACTN|nr:hypothetical protein [Planobispora longispora]BFE87186.1 hypothetical protein GCM10020093_097870 [Planobispora longispora]GIH74793.1 hypothetical protein Plo01_12220 [Planobispora longispora]